MCGTGKHEICIDFGRLDPDSDPHWEYKSGSGSVKAKMNHKKEKVKKHVLKFSFKG
jgi:hypothetical protein